MKLVTIETLRAKRPEILEIARRHGATNIRIIGSLARGEEHENSDIDLLVETGDGVTSWFPAGLVLELESLLGRPVDIVTDAGLSPLLRSRVLQEAQLL